MSLTFGLMLDFFLNQFVTSIGTTINSWFTKKKKLQNFVYLLNRANHCGIYITELYIEITQPFLNLEEASLLAEMFGGSDFWLETRVIIKISKKIIPHMKPKFFFMRLSDISSKTGRKCIFCVLGHFWAYVGQLHGHLG